MVLPVLPSLANISVADEHPFETAQSLQNANLAQQLANMHAQQANQMQPQMLQAQLQNMQARTGLTGAQQQYAQKQADDYDKMLAMRQAAANKLSGTAGQLQHAYNLMSSNDPLEKQQGSQLLQSVQNLSNQAAARARNLSANVQLKNLPTTARQAYIATGGPVGTGLGQPQSSGAQATTTGQPSLSNIQQSSYSQPVQDAIKQSGQIAFSQQGVPSSVLQMRPRILTANNQLNNTLAELNRIPPKYFTGRGSLNNALKYWQTKLGSDAANDPGYQALLNFKQNKNLFSQEALKAFGGNMSDKDVAMYQSLIADPADATPLQIRNLIRNMHNSLAEQSGVLTQTPLQTQQALANIKPMAEPSAPQATPVNGLDAIAAELRRRGVK